MSEETVKASRWVRVLLVLLPAWLVVSGTVAVWKFAKKEQQKATARPEWFASPVSSDSVRDDLGKLIHVVGERNLSSADATRNLGRAAAMIEGSMGPSNTGYLIRKTEGPAGFPLIEAGPDAVGTDAPAVWILCAYDSRPGSPGAEANASGITAVMAAARTLAGQPGKRPVRYLFLPHGHDPDSPLAETLRLAAARFTRADIVLCVEAMGAEDPLWLSSRDTTAMALALTEGIGEVKGSEVVCLGEFADLSALIFDLGFPAVRVATRPIVLPTEPDTEPADPLKLAASSTRLVELIRRCAALP